MTTPDSTHFDPATIYRAPDGTVYEIVAGLCRDCAFGRVFCDCPGEPGRYGTTLVCRRGGEKWKCLKLKETT